MITFSYLCNTNMPISIQHRAGNLDNFTLTKTKKFVLLEECLTFYNECFFPLTSLEEITKAYNQKLKANKRGIKQTFLTYNYFI